MVGITCEHWNPFNAFAVDPPLRRRNEAFNKVVDISGTSLSLYPHVPPILFFLQRKGITVAAASRTCAPSVARQALNNLILLSENQQSSGPSARQSNNGKIAPRPASVKAISLFDHLEIYPGSKLAHFRALHAKTGIDYNDMGMCIADVSGSFSQCHSHSFLR